MASLSFWLTEQKWEEEENKQEVKCVQLYSDGMQREVNRNEVHGEMSTF